MENLYHTLGLLPNANDEQIRNKLLNKISNKQIEIDAIEKYKEILLNEEKKKKYNAKLLTEHPDLIQAMADDKAMQIKHNLRNSSKSTPFSLKLLTVISVVLVVLVIFNISIH